MTITIEQFNFSAGSARSLQIVSFRVSVGFDREYFNAQKHFCIEEIIQNNKMKGQLRFQ